MFVPTTAVKKLSKLKKRIKGVQGGTSASKTISILQILIDKAQRDKTPTLTSVTSESVPHLKRGAMRDFKNIMQEHGYWKEKRWNATDFTYTFETGSKIEFFSLDMPHKVRGPRRQRLFINEANNIPYETFDQLEIRTEDEIWLDWNPVAEFWWHEGENGNQAVRDRDDADSIILTYLDNEGLPDSIIKSIESHKGNKNWWRVYGQGLIGEVEGRIYTDWRIIDEVPHEARLERYGLDFGYTNDPTAVIAIYRYNGGFVLDEVLYRKGMLNKDIADFMKNQKDSLIVADSAEPKSITELNTYGLRVVKAKKGKDSIKFGIATVQQQRISVTKRSTNLLKEYRRYMWEVDDNGKILQTPERGLDHCFVGNTNINTNKGIIQIKDVRIGDEVLTNNGYKEVLIKHNNGVKLVNKYTLQLDTGDDIVISCTPNHKIKTDKGWTQISRLKSGMTVTLTKSLTEKFTNSIQEKDISLKAKIECTLLYGSFITDQLKKAIKFITKTLTTGITGLKTLNLLNLISICLTTVKRELKKIQSGLRSFSKWALKRLQSGINQKKEESGTQNMVKRLGIIGNIKLSFVKSVKKNTKQDTQEYPNIAIITAKLKHLGVEESWNEKVYDLTVKDNHEYFANRLLVHNCMDAVRYGIKNIIPQDKIKPDPMSGQALLNQLGLTRRINRYGKA